MSTLHTLLRDFKLPPEAEGLFLTFFAMEDAGSKLNNRPEFSLVTFSVMFGGVMVNQLGWKCADAIREASRCSVALNGLFIFTNHICAACHLYTGLRRYNNQSCEDAILHVKKAFDIIPQLAEYYKELQEQKWNQKEICRAITVLYYIWWGSKESLPMVYRGFELMTLVRGCLRENDKYLCHNVDAAHIVATKLEDIGDVSAEGIITFALQLLGDIEFSKILEEDLGLAKLPETIMD